MSERVLVAEHIDGLGMMLADLVRGNLAAHPDRARILDHTRGTVTVAATDADVRVGLRFDGGTMHVTDPIPGADLVIETDAGTLLELSTVPLRFGQPDALTPEGRAILGKLAKGGLKIHGMLRHQKLLVRLTKLLSVR